MLVLAIFTSVAKASKELNSEVLEEFELYWVPCIYYLAKFNEFSIETFIDSSSKINAI